MHVPLAEQLRPKELKEIIGQEHLLGKEGVISRALALNRLFSMILYGPPGCGKTTLVRALSNAFSLEIEHFSASLGSLAEIKQLLKEIEKTPLLRKGVIIFVDEIHRFNKSQQDSFLPFVESGKIILIGATTENPSFYLNNSLLSRMQVLKLNPLNDDDLNTLLERYEKRFSPLLLTQSARQKMIALSLGDARYLWNMVEALPKDGSLIEENELETYIQKRAALFDKHQDYHHQTISALHKSVRGSDPDAALYWFARMLEGGEEPLYIARRLIRMAVEDIGLADPGALNLAIGARDAYQMLGSPEGELALAEVVVYLALSPKSNAVYKAYGLARECAEKTSHLSPPEIIINPSTSLMKEWGYGKGYLYDPDTPLGFSGQNYFPKEMERQNFYQPYPRGFEREMMKRADYFKKLRDSLSTPPAS